MIRKTLLTVIALVMALSALLSGRSSEGTQITEVSPLQVETSRNRAVAVSTPTIIPTPAPAATQEEAFEPLDISLPVELQEHAWNEAQRIGIDPAILYKLMWRESGYQVDAWCVDSNGYESVGLCQINGITFSWCEERGIDPRTPEGNITAAAELISYYLTERGCTLEQALAAYGAGESGMRAGMGKEAARKLLEGGVPET